MADTIYSIPTIATYLIIAEADIKVLQVTIQTRMSTYLCQGLTIPL